MSATYDIITAFKLTIDATGANGEGEACTLPKITAKTEEFVGGGMLASIDIPMGMIEKMEFECKLNSFNGDAFARVAATPDRAIDVVVRGNISQTNGTQAGAVARMRGYITEAAPDELSPGKKVQTSVKMSVHYYKLTVAGVDKLEVDAMNYKLVQDGTDRLAAVRQNLGI